MPNHKLGLFANAHRADGDVESGEQLAHADPGRQVSEVANQIPPFASVKNAFIIEAFYRFLVNYKFTDSFSLLLLSGRPDRLVSVESKGSSACSRNMVYL